MARQRYDRNEQVRALLAEERTLTASQVADATGLGLAMTNRYLARLLNAGELVATAPPDSTKRGYGATRRGGGRRREAVRPSVQAKGLSAFTTDG